MSLSSRPRPSFVVALVASIGLALGYAAKSFMTDSQAPPAQPRGLSSAEPRTSIQPVSPQYRFNPELYPSRIFDAAPPRVALPTLQVLTRGTSSDGEAITRVIDYYRGQRNRLAREWDEHHPDRLKALFAMYVIHVSHPYGSAENPRSFLRYVRENKFAHCGLYGYFQSRLLDAFDLEWRYVFVSSGEHGWIEVLIDGRWEVFDATTNLWIDRSGFELLAGHRRQYRAFYRPWSDRERPDARQYIDGWREPYEWGPGVLRSRMIGLGISYLSREELAERGVSLQVWNEFEPPGV